MEWRTYSYEKQVHLEIDMERKKSVLAHWLDYTGDWNYFF